jgi:hypothetical protein
LSRFAVSAIAPPALCAPPTAVSLACSTVLLPADELERRLDPPERRLLDERERPPLDERGLLELLVRLEVLPLRERVPLDFDFGFAVERPFADARGFEREVLEARLVC